MKQVVTRDGTITYYNIEYGETYHSSSGAMTEAMEKFVKPAELKPGMKVLDFCFGLGYNTMAALSICRDIDVVAVEKDERIIEAAKKISLIGYRESQRIVHNLIEKKEISNGKLQLFLEDGEEFLKCLSDASFDVVFFDPFSPKKHPQMWTYDIFKEMNRVLKKGGRLLTYSCAGHVRRSMKEAGFFVADGPSVGRRSPSTIGVKH